MPYFKILAKNRQARTGILNTGHGPVNTPAFVPVATHGALNILGAGELYLSKVQILISNALHLYLGPGPDLVEDLGGLHSFMSYNGPLMTDSGGFQAFSMGEGRHSPLNKAGSAKIGKKGKQLAEIDDNGIFFKSYINGSKHFLGPLKAISIQKKLAPDIFFVLDECTSPLHDYDYTEKAMQRSFLWAEKCLNEFLKIRKTGQAIFGIIQGGTFEDLRITSSRLTSSLNFDGYGIGGVLGKTKSHMFRVVEWASSYLEEEKPRHLLGIGEIEDIFAGVNRGMDLFDCILPTRLARFGTFLVKNRPRNRLNINNSRFKTEKKPVDENCGCPACKNYSRAFLHHLFKVKEPLSYRLAAVHNIMFMEKMMQEIRTAINNNKWDQLMKEWSESGSYEDIGLSV